jgi:hypothetical protein
MIRVRRFVSGVGMLSLPLLAMSSSACGKQDKASSTTVTGAPSALTSVTESTPGAAPPPSVRPGDPAQAFMAWRNIGLSSPESVIYDEVGDVYLVSNMDGQPTDADRKAFITKLSPEGKVIDLKWIDSGKNNVTLNAPKGMGIAGDHLYVADIDTVRIFDRTTGAPLGQVKIPNATFLNDVAIDADGRVLVSDSGFKAGAKGLVSSNNDAVYAVEPGNPDAKDRKVKAIAKSKDLGGPNGIALVGDKMWVGTTKSGELYALDAKGKKGDVQKLPRGALDGVVAMGDELLVSSWDANAIYRLKPGGEVKLAVQGVRSPADIAYDKKRKRLLVPLLIENEVRVYDLE